MSTMSILDKGSYTCVIIKGDHTYTSQMRGVKPLVQFLRSRLDLRGATAADRVVGRATAFLYVLLGVRAVYAKIMSQGAFEVLVSHGIRAECDHLTAHIINRRGDGICPFEEAVFSTKSPESALKIIEEKMLALGIEI